MDDRLEFCLDARLENLHEFRDYISRTGRGLGINPDLIGQLVLVVDEAITNIVVHGYGGTGGPVELQMDLKGKNIFIRIHDQAEEFDPGAIEPPPSGTPLSERPPGGMGLFLMDHTMDAVEFRPLAGGGNELRMVKRMA